MVEVKVGNTNLHSRLIMKRIGLISDTHNYLDEAVFKHFERCDEIWHAGDFGTIELADRLREFKPLRGVYGNIDDNDIRSVYPLSLRWKCEDVDIYMTHIGGYPPRYNTEVKKVLTDNPPQLFICGHSHILKIMFDDKLQCLHMNPGAADTHGWHKMRTLIRFTVDGKNMKDCEVIELGKRG
jgi:putative phosphoesterase